MTQYLLSIHQPDGPPPGPEVMDRVARDLHVLNEELKAAGSWVFTGGLHAPSSVTVVRLRDGDVVTTDGPYVEGKELIGGFALVEVADLDEAIAMARTWPGRSAVEVRPLVDH